MSTNYKNTIRSISLLLACSLICLHTAIAQEDENDYRKNSIYATYGNLIFTSQASISYERSIFKFGQNNRTKLKATYGNNLGNNLDYDTGERVYENYTGLSVVQLFGKFETNLGAAYASYTLAPGFNPDPDIDYSLVENAFVLFANIGYRYENDHFLFRAGVGNLDLLYVGLGFNF